MRRSENHEGKDGALESGDLIMIGVKICMALEAYVQDNTVPLEASDRTKSRK